MAYTTIDNPELYFQAKTYTGTNSSTAFTLDGSEDMQPDWVWLKVRSAGSGQDHTLYDSVRGATKFIEANTNNAEATGSNYLTSFDSDGFTLGNDQSHVNANTDTYVSWNWKAGTSFTNDASATSVGSIDSAGSISTTAGFSIISYTGTGSVGTVAHGIGTPKMILFKNRSTASNWLVYHEGIGNTKNLYLDANNAEHDRSDTFNDTSPTSSVFTVGTADLNGDGNSIIAYCFSQIKGYSKFGTYTGSGNVDGPVIYTGFSPAFVILKRTNTDNHWIMFDNKRDPHNEALGVLYPSQDAVEDRGTGTNDIDFLSTGFKVREDNGECNGSGDSYIYMAFAEAPLVNSNGVPGKAR